MHIRCTFFLACLCILVSPVHAQDGFDSYKLALGSLLTQPDDPGVILQYAGQAAEAGDATGVVASLERLLVFEPRLSNLRFELGLLYLRTGLPELAEPYLREALSDPAIPADIKTRGLELIEQAQVDARPWSVSGYGAVGLRYDTNANSGPGGVVQFVASGAEVQGRLRPEDTGQPDFSATAFLTGSYRHDLGFQASHDFVLPATLFAQKYREQNQLDVLYLNASPGVEFNLTPVLDRPAQLTVSTFFARLVRDDERYLDEAGGFIEAALRQDARLLWRAGFNGKYQQFSRTAEAPLNDLRDGGFYGAFVGADYDLSSTTQVTVDLLGRRKTARADFEAFREYGGVLQIKRLADLGAWSKHGLWQFGLTATYSVVDYDDLDLSIDLNTAQNDRRYRIEGQFDAPVSDKVIVNLRFGYYRNQSNFAIRDYDDTYVAVTAGRAF
ncbi:MAG: hypothetical protein AAGF46_09375 [Pseudomonadota bacterium]